MPSKRDEAVVRELDELALTVEEAGAGFFAELGQELGDGEEGWRLPAVEGARRSAVRRRKGGGWIDVLDGAVSAEEIDQTILDEGLVDSVLLWVGVRVVEREVRDSLRRLCEREREAVSRKLVRRERRPRPRTSKDVADQKRVPVRGWVPERPQRLGEVLVLLHARKRAAREQVLHKVKIDGSARDRRDTRKRTERLTTAFGRLDGSCCKSRSMIFVCCSMATLFQLEGKLTDGRRRSRMTNARSMPVESGKHISKKMILKTKRVGRSIQRHARDGSTCPKRKSPERVLEERSHRKMSAKPDVEDEDAGGLTMSALSL